MSARYKQRTSRQARWSRRVAMFGAQLLIVGVLLHYFDAVTTTTALYIVAAALIFAMAALILSASSFVMVWRHGLQGGGYAVSGAIVACLVLAGPVLLVPKLLLLPQINDISTNTLDPPKFETVSTLRPSDANGLRYPGPEVALKQLAAYPDIRPMELERSGEEAFKLVRDAVERLGWDVVAESKPAKDQAGRIEAVSRTMIMGFSDDVVIRVSSGAKESLVDVRSASRYGQHDFGTNAKRIKRLFAEVKAGLEKGERTALEVALARRAVETRKQEKIAKEKARKEARLRAEEEAARQRALLEDARERQEEQLRAIQEEQLRIQSQLPEGQQNGLFPFPAEAQDEPKPRVQRRGGRWNQPADRFFRQFGE